MEKKRQGQSWLSESEVDSASFSKKYPQLYKEGIRNSYFNCRVVAAWSFSAVYQSLVLYHFETASSSTGLNSSGKMFGLWDVSTMAFTFIVVKVNLRLLLMCNSITRCLHIAVSGSILGMLVFIFICLLMRMRFKGGSSHMIIRYYRKF
ncbi:hypothetical protein EUGRSUZ_G00549 [Eucalyptus grandis]|uniref:Uncharacterized protein n=2 Tax=Eucalyptus grandis TaxID=71139 RepID=A0ACC3K0D1_EUCGR|nr:hypothetical protein EUGRSUZ_G00549 [Eucalyptus grandis]